MTRVVDEPRTGRRGGLGVDQVLDALDPSRRRRRAGSGWLLRCPHHDDREHSLSVGRADHGGVVIKCHSGCSVEDVVAAGGLTMADLAPPATGSNGKVVHLPRTVTQEWVFPAHRAATGEAVSAHVRRDFDELDPRSGKPVKSYTWRPSLSSISVGVRDLALWRWETLGQLEDGADVHLVEGELTANALAWAGVAAVGTMTGASTVPGDESLQPLARLRVVLWPDNDAAGERHMAQVAAALRRLGCREVLRIRWPQAPEKGDAADLVRPLRDAGVEPGEVRAAIEALPCSPWTDVPEGDERGMPAELARTDSGNAERLVGRHGGELRWSGALRRWFRWDGRRWDPVEAETVQRLLQAVITEEACRLFADEDATKADLKWAIDSRNRNRIEAALSLARSMDPVHVDAEALDAQLHLLTCLDGTVDLRTGRMRAHDPVDRITKLAPVAFDGDDGDRDWADWMARTVPDEEVRRWLQILVGASLLGRNSEERLPFLVGPTGTGKTTTLEAIRHALGDYAGDVPFEALLDTVRGSGGARPDLARLRGKRFVIASEVSEGQKWNAGLVKSLTGGETITVRELYSNPVTFVPTFTVFAAANSTPRVDSEDDAMWRRLAVVRFDQQPARRDPRVKARITDPSRTGGAVLRWAVAGAVAYQAEGLGSDPAGVAQATETYRRSQDRLADFLEDQLEVTGSEWDHVVARELYERYQGWAKDNGERFPLSQKAIGVLLRGRGCEPTHNTARTERWWRGLRWR